MSKKDDLLNKPKATQYELNADEKAELSALMELVSQAQKAQDIIYSNLVSHIADRYELANSSLSINMEQVMQQGIAVAHLIVVE